jgi:rare lipoprotein A
MPQHADVKTTGHTPAHRFAAVTEIGEPGRRREAQVSAMSDRQRWPVIPTLLATVGLVGLLLAAIPDVTDGSPSQGGQVGVASWYGKRHQGRKTASGEGFSRGSFTAAHRSLPLGTTVLVTNLRTQQRVVVTITDRGPYGGGSKRIIDLSEAAAAHVGLLQRGTERVQVVVIEPAS